MPLGAEVSSTRSAVCRQQEEGRVGAWLEAYTGVSSSPKPVGSPGPLPPFSLTWSQQPSPAGAASCIIHSNPLLSIPTAAALVRVSLAPAWTGTVAS